MKRILAVMIAALASFGLAVASTSALAQKTDAAKDAKKVEAPKTDAKKADVKKPDAPKMETKGEPMDINSATEKELATLKGIGEVRAKAIVKGRPYKGKDDLVKKNLVPRTVYDGIKDQIVAKQK
jgi:competence protein ComEA